MKKVLLLVFCLLILGTSIFAASAKPLVLTMFSGDINPDDTGFEDPIAKEITKRTGIKLKTEYPVGEYEQKVTLMIASGEYPDLIFHKGAGPFVEAKAFVDLTPYIEKYGDNVKKLYGPYLKRLRYSAEDKSIYFLGCFGVGSETWDVSGVQLQHAVVKELGYPRIETVKDFENAIKAYKEKYPTINGKPTIGLSLLADDWRMLITVTNQAVFATGGPERQAGMYERTYGNYPVVLDERFKRAELQDPGYSAGWGIAISTKCKDKVAAFKFLDWMASDEAQILNNWGIEGVNYQVVNGKRVIPPDELDRKNNDPLYRKKTGVGLYVHPFPQRGDGVKDPTGNTYTTLTPDFIINRYSDVEKEVLAGYGAKMWMDLFPQRDEFPVKTWGACWQIPEPQDPAYKVPWQKGQDIIKKRIPEAILAKPDKFDEIWDQFMKELEAAGIPQAEAIFNQLLEEKIKLWNE